MIQVDEVYVSTSKNYIFINENTDAGPIHLLVRGGSKSKARQKLIKYLAHAWDDAEAAKDVVMDDDSIFTALATFWRVI